MRKLSKEYQDKLDVIIKYIKEKKGIDVKKDINLDKPRTMDLGGGMSVAIGEPPNDLENEWYIDSMYKYAKEYFTKQKKEEDE